jgi:hypothetical protein
VGPGNDCLLEIGLAVVGEQELRRAAGKDLGDRQTDHAERRNLVVGHLQSAVHPAGRLLTAVISKQRLLAKPELRQHAVEGSRQPACLVVTVHVGHGIEIAFCCSLGGQLHLVQRITDELGDPPARHRHHQECHHSKADS